MVTSSMQSVTDNLESSTARQRSESTRLAKALSKDGIAQLGSLVDSEDIRAILAWLEAREAANDKLVDELEPDFDVSQDGGRRLGRIRRLLWADPRFWAPIFTRSRIIERAVELVGPEANLLFHTAFMKPSLFGSEVTLHQDQGVYPWNLPYSITIWIALTPSRISNGCVVGYPGSHRDGLIPHVLKDGTVVDMKTGKWASSWPSIPSTRFHESPVHYELEPGEAVAWHHYFVHGSAQNCSGADRKGMSMIFTDPSRSGFQAPDFDHRGRKIELLSVSEIRSLADAANRSR